MREDAFTSGRTEEKKLGQATIKTVKVEREMGDVGGGQHLSAHQLISAKSKGDHDNTGSTGNLTTRKPLNVILIMLFPLLDLSGTIQTCFLQQFGFQVFFSTPAETN